MRAEIKDGYIKVYDSYLYKESIKEIDGRFYDADDKAWCIPVSARNAATVELLGAEVDDEIKELAKTQKTEQKVSETKHPEPKVKATLYQHQKNAYDYALDTFEEGKALAILADMGTGKSLMTIAIVGTLIETKAVKKLLVVCPKSIVGVWETEFQKFAAYRYALKVLEGTIQKKKDAFKFMNGEALQVIVVNYESCWRLEEEINKWNPDMIVCDESSKIKNPGTSQSKALHRLGKKSRFNVILTGTPVTNNPLDFYSQYKFLDEDVLGSSYYLFKNRYVVMGGFQNRQIVGYRHLAELVEKVHSIAFRIKLNDAVELPEAIDEIRTLNLDSKETDVYKMLQDDCYVALSEEAEVTITNVMTMLIKLSQCTGGFVRGDKDENNETIPVQVGTTKLEALEDAVEACLEEGKKVVVFARFTPEIAEIAKMLEKNKIGYSHIQGETKDRAEQVRRFQEDPDVKVFVGQLQTTGMGLTLTAASVAIYYSYDYSYANYEQSKARIHRIGQKDKCLYVHLVAKNTIDEQIIATLKRKGNIANLMVDNWRELLNGED